MSIEVSKLSFSYGDQLIFDDISFTAHDNQLLSIIGSNGAGKSTMFRCMLGLLNGYEGKVLFNGTDIKGLSIKEMAKLVAYIPQSHYPSFNFSVFDMVLMGTTTQVSSIASPGEKQIRNAQAALERMGIEHIKNRGYTHISGGERQLVLIARALVQEAKVLIMDEPTANLDFGNQIRVMSEIKSLTRDGYTIIQSTHNPEQAFQFSDSVLALKNGKILAGGAPADIFTEPLIQTLYGIDVEMQTLYEGKVKVCIPKCVIY
ncbi:ABC transporter ATP-binding protein [Clostridium sp. PL3]|uniref:ABC transporter ATP-binding protein n=1 Tax=Clostridium thailandense TaxID=2794346 RepID=A0A949WR38_9CLOT|nr:ABC transporter ATP-binding protein [Clostridium thailandense]MBV7273516.1 ABC transporter ATP-binding protein [Clostridium thailandense]